MKLFSKLLLAGGILAVAEGFDRRLEVTHWDLDFQNLPAEFDGFRIAHISDLHSESAPCLARAIADGKPDIIVITGDILHDDDRPTAGVFAFLEQLLDIAPVYMVSGNHDLWNTSLHDFLHRACAAGVHFIDDRMEILDRGGAQIAVFGMRDPFGKAPGVIKKSLSRSVRTLPDYDGFKILLFHRANQFEKIKALGFDLILSGHMHGGQVRLPGVGGVLPPKSSLVENERGVLFPNYCAGVFKSSGTTMLVNRGIGNPMIIPRLFNRPELGIVTLRKSEE